MTWKTNDNVKIVMKRIPAGQSQVFENFSYNNSFTDTAVWNI
jgi:hypothetical protein